MCVLIKADYLVCKANYLVIVVSLPKVCFCGGPAVHVHNVHNW